MHLPTHVMSGWCVADLFALTPRERLFAMVAASAADLDGLGLFISLDYYAAYHHVLAHNLPIGVVVSTALALASTHRLRQGGMRYEALNRLKATLAEEATEYLGADALASAGSRPRWWGNLHAEYERSACRAERQ